MSLPRFIGLELRFKMLEVSKACVALEVDLNTILFKWYCAFVPRGSLPAGVLLPLREDVRDIGDETSNWITFSAAPGSLYAGSLSKSPV